MALFPGHWATLIDAIRIGAVKCLLFAGVDISALADDAFLAAVACRGLKSLVVQRSVLASGFSMDELIRFSAPKCLTQLSFHENKSDAPHSLSEDAVLDFCFPPDAAPGRHSRTLVREGSGITDLFLTKFFEVRYTDPGTGSAVSESRAHLVRRFPPEH